MPNKPIGCFFDRYSVKTRMWVVIGLIVFACASIAFLSNRTVAQAREKALALCSQLAEDTQRQRIEIATKTLAYALGEEIKGIEDLETKRDLICSAVKDLRYNEDESGYFFVYEGTVVVSVPPQPELTGKDFSELADANGVFFVPLLLEKAQQGGGFVDYLFDKPGSGVLPKVSYAVMIPHSPYFIGTGVYLDKKRPRH